MTLLPFNRRKLLAGLSATGLVPRLATAAVSAAQGQLSLGDGRLLPWLRWTAPSAKGNILLSHGGNSWPEQYDKLAQYLVAQGYSVVAPVHTDSLHMAEDRRTDMRAAFRTRIADVVAVAEDLTSRGKDSLPLVVMGHSYGSLFALMLGGALDYVAPIYNPNVKALVCFSSPGAVPGLVTPTAYSGLKSPLLMITGDQDIVPGFVSDWHDHLLPFTGSPVAESYLLTVEGGTHELVSGTDTARFDIATAVVRDFLTRELSGSLPVINLPSGAKAELKKKA